MMMTEAQIEQLADKLLKALEEKGMPNSWHNLKPNHPGVMVEVQESCPVAQRRAILEVLLKELLR